MSYVKQTWVDNVTPLNAEHMNHIEDGISKSVFNGGMTQIVDTTLSAAVANVTFADIGQCQRVFVHVTIPASTPTIDVYITAAQNRDTRKRLTTANVAQHTAASYVCSTAYISNGRIYGFGINRTTSDPLTSINATGSFSQIGWNAIGAMEAQHIGYIEIGSSLPANTRIQIWGV